MPDAKNSQRASKYQAQRAQYADAIAVNPVVNNPPVSYTHLTLPTNREV